MRTWFKQHVGQQARLHWQAMGNMILPPRCYGCGTETSQSGLLCPDCFAGLRPITPPFCQSCALPMDDHEILTSTHNTAPVCAWCLARQSPLQALRAAFVYDDGSKPLVLAFKHGDRTDMAPALAAWLGRTARDIITEDMLVIPVPLWRGRLFRRRYNQAAELARILAKQENLTCLPDGLVRHRNTGDQGGKSASARRRNVNTAFKINPRQEDRISAQKVLLLDDVYTTGATLEACAKTLLQAGAESVTAVVIARVNRPGRGRG